MKKTGRASLSGDVSPGCAGFYAYMAGLSSAIFFFLLSESVVGAAEAIISKVSDPSGNFCHLKFPAIREDTLFSDRPVLKDSSEGDIIDFYGPCNYDPLGRDSVLRQRFEHQLRMRREYGRD